MKKIKKDRLLDTSVKPMGTSEIRQQLFGIRGWKIARGRLVKCFKFKDFKRSLDFVNDVAMIAEKENHHPDFRLSYGFVEIRIWTHSIKGLSLKDFLLAGKIDLIKK